jgi:NADPH:quinone reductase-like Zn-dependent oxidoreductase
MRAAVVTSFGTPPSCQDFPEPTPGAPDELVVEVLAAGLHRRVRSQADGSHYTSTGDLPLVPGIDGVGCSQDGTLYYFILADTTLGTMAERTLIDRRRSVVLPPGTDPVLVAAAMNPAMSSWLPLRRRIDFRPGQSVLVLGATGSSGQFAVQVARHLGAGQVIAAGRHPQRLAELSQLGADQVVSLSGEPAEVARRLGTTAGDVQVVIDYLWGQPAADAMVAIISSRSDRGLPLSWVEVGSVAGPTAEIPSAALRAARLQIVGSGQGSIPTHDILAELPDLAAEISAGTFRLATRTVPLADVGAAWLDTESGDRIVITPGQS